MLRPIGRRVLVEMDANAESTAGGIIIPDTEDCPERYSNMGTVIACGPGGCVLRDTSQKRERDYVRDTGDRYRYVPVAVKPGDRVWCGAFNGLRVPESLSDGRHLRMMEADTDIYLVQESP